MTRHRKRRGRKADPHARRKQTTRAGRLGNPVIDRGTAELLQHRQEATTQADLPEDPLGVLLGRNLIDARQYAAGRDVGELITLARSGWPGKTASVWLRILAGGVMGGTAPDRSWLSERAADKIGWLKRQLGPEFDLIYRVAAAEYCPSTVGEISTVAVGLDRVARLWSSGRAA